MEVNQSRESMNETAEYQRRKISEIREAFKKANSAITIYLDTQ